MLQKEIEDVLRGWVFTPEVTAKLVYALARRTGGEFVEDALLAAGAGPHQVIRLKREVEVLCGKQLWGSRQLADEIGWIKDRLLFLSGQLSVNWFEPKVSAVVSELSDIRELLLRMK